MEGKKISSSDSDIDFLSDQINEETKEEFGSYQKFAFFIRDEAQKIIAGCNGWIIFGSIYTDQLWVHPKHRGLGMAAKLMDDVHQLGREHGCSMATVCTMSFQKAQSFYEKLDYHVDFSQAGYVHNSSCIYLSRSL